MTNDKHPPSLWSVVTGWSLAMDLCYDSGVPRTYLVCILVICSIISELKVSQMNSFPTQGTAYRVRIVTTEYSWCMSSQSSPFLKTASTCSSRVFSITTKPWPIARITCTVLHRNPPPCPALHSSWTCPIFPAGYQDPNLHSLRLCTVDEFDEMWLSEHEGTVTALAAVHPNIPAQ